MDATYKVTKWSFPFFIISVVTNHGHGFPVAFFFCEHETGAAIAEALKMIQRWNPDWFPTYVMVDKDAKEENAINEVFGSSTTLLLCDFQRLQAWWRRLNKSDMGQEAGHLPRWGESTLYQVRSNWK